MSRFARHRDREEPAIVAAFIACGCTVLKLSGPTGSPDLCVGANGINLLVEVKSPFESRDEKSGYTQKRNASKGQLSPKQEVWHQKWRGQVAIVRTPDEAVALVMPYLTRVA